MIHYVREPNKPFFTMGKDILGIGESTNRTVHSRPRREVLL